LKKVSGLTVSSKSKSACDKSDRAKSGKERKPSRPTDTPPSLADSAEESFEDWFSELALLEAVSSAITSSRVSLGERFSLEETDAPGEADAALACASNEAIFCRFLSPVSYISQFVFDFRLRKYTVSSLRKHIQDSLPIRVTGRRHLRRILFACTSHIDLRGVVRMNVNEIKKF
jgi:hypothetical protein